MKIRVKGEYGEVEVDMNLDSKEYQKEGEQLKKWVLDLYDKLKEQS